MIPEDEFDDSQLRVVPGNHHQITLTSKDKICLKGYIKNKNEKILITTQSKFSKKLKTLKIKA